MGKIKSNTALFTKSGCLSQEAILKYIEGSLNKKDQHIVEMHTIDCQLCSDAIEGLSAVNKNQLQNILNDLKSAKNIKRKNLRAWVVYSSIAAAIGIFGISAVITINLNKISNDKNTALENKINTGESSKTEKSNSLIPQEELAFNSENKQNGPEIPAHFEVTSINDQQELLVKENLFYKKENSKNPQVETKNTDTAKSGLSLVDADGEVENNDKSGGEVVEKLSEAKTTTVDETEVTSVYDKKGVKRSKNKSANKDKMAQKAVGGKADFDDNKKEEANSVYAEGIALYNSANYQEAIIKFEYLIKTNFQNCDAKFYCALSYYKVKNSKSALKQLDDLTRDNNNICYEKALFQKALILSNTGKKTEADKIFKKIINEKGSFTEDAEKELNKK